MKKIFLLLIFLQSSFIFGYADTYSYRAEILTTKNINHQWSSWRQWLWVNAISSNNNGEFASFTFWHLKESGENWCFKFGIDNFKKLDKKEIKKHWKEKQAFIFNGWVEYYVAEEYPTIKSQFEAGNSMFNLPFVTPSSSKEWNYGPYVKRHAKASIKILPFKKFPETFYIYFEDVAVGVSFKCVSKYKKWVKNIQNYFISK